MSTAVIFGGTGFIGTHFAAHLIEKQLVDHVILADIKPLSEDQKKTFLNQYLNAGTISYQQSDVRQDISIACDDAISLIGNFAAIHREPGHERHEYFDTNIPGAENVCKWATNVNCSNIIFTSSIAPYGPTETPKDENSEPKPETAYGESKLQAEGIHRDWAKSQQGKLTIVRPGVVFGPGEGGNVSRLVKAVLGHYFIYTGNRDTRKAGIYVKELCNAMVWVNDKVNPAEPILFNMSMNPGPSIEEYVNAICKCANRRAWIPSLPYKLLYAAASVIEPIARLLRIDQPISPVRIRKLVRSNHIIPQYLEDSGYKYLYNLDSAMQDWKANKPVDWQ